MKNLKILSIAILGAAFFFASCQKERDCECISTWTSADGTSSMDTSVVTTKEKCWEGNLKYTDDDNDKYERTCEKK